MEHLSAVDLKIMERFRNIVLEEKENLIPIEELLNKYYYNNKETLYQLLGNNYKLSIPFKYSKSKEEMKEEINAKLLNFLTVNFCIQYEDWCDFYAKTQTNYTTERHILREILLEEDNYISNRLVTLERYGTITIECPDGKSFKINKDTKLMRFFGKIVNNFSSHFDKEMFEKFRLKHSLICNDAKFENTLTISIHPLDYWTMSDNTSNWNSCLSWLDNGSYRAGAIEMMNSPCVIMAYLESNDPMPIGEDYEWNNKIWRELYVVDKNLIMSIKGYPYSNFSISSYIVSWLKELAEKNLSWEYENDVKYIDFYEEDIGFEDDKGTHEIYLSMNTMYNDFNNMDNFVIVYALDPVSDCEGEYVIECSGPRQCLSCGKTSFFIKQTI